MRLKQWAHSSAERNNDTQSLAEPAVQMSSFEPKGPATSTSVTDYGWDSTPHNPSPSGSEQLLSAEAYPRNLDHQPAGNFVKWKVTWKTPVFMASLLISGITFAIGHHAYYTSLHNSPAGNNSRQQWAKSFGTAFSFLIVALLRTACTTAYQQHLWTLVKKKPLELGTLDKLFALTSDPTGFFHMNLLSNAKMAILVALICWCLPLAGVAPPATLVVVPGQHNQTVSTLLPTLDWNVDNFWYLDATGEVRNLLPSPETMNVARMAASSMAISPPAPPATNSSFGLQFYGPSVQCAPANSTQQPYFDGYVNSLVGENASTVAKSTLGSIAWGPSKDSSGAVEIPLMLISSMFDPFGYKDVELISESAFRKDNIIDMSKADFDEKFYPESAWNDSFVKNFPGSSIYNPQLWIQTASDSIVCRMTNASFDVQYEYVSGAQTQVQYSVSDNQIYWAPFLDNHASLYSKFKSYGAIFSSLYNLLNGNITLTIYDVPNGRMITGTEYLYEQTSEVLQTGLSACDDYVDNYWNSNPVGMSVSTNATTTTVEFVPWDKAYTDNTSSVSWDFIYNKTALPSSMTNLFIKDTKPDWMCRNRTLARAVEDLMNNITISMLSRPDFTDSNGTSGNVIYFESRNVYQYDSRNLLISYSIAIFLTILIVGLGFHALHSNGVAHSTSFSALITTTRNSRLDELSRGHTLGALPLDERVLKAKLRFGELGEGEGDWGAGETHLGFGFAENVVGMRKRGRYV